MATLYVSPIGSGDRSGSSWANAAKITSLNSLIDKAGPGGQVLLRADQGAYKVVDPILISNGGDAGKPVVIRGVDGQGRDMHATIVGDRPTRFDPDGDRGNELFKLREGADNLKFTDLTVRDTGVVFRAGADLERITIDDVDAVNVARFFENLASGGSDTATIDRLTIRNVEIAGFSEFGIHLQYDTHTVKIENVHADSKGQVGDPWIQGVHLDGTVHDVVIRNTSMSNIRAKADTDEYWNGDGFSTERGVYDVRFENTVARGNTDGGYDLKSNGTVLVNALGADNGRNYRFWGEAELIDSVGLSPNVRGGLSNQNHVWVASGAEVRIEGGLFRDSDGQTTVFEGKNATVSFDDVDVYRAAGTRLAHLYSSKLKGLGEINDNFLAAGSGLGLADGTMDAIGSVEFGLELLDQPLLEQFNYPLGIDGIF